MIERTGREQAQVQSSRQAGGHVSPARFRRVVVVAPLFLPIPSNSPKYFAYVGGPHSTDNTRLGAFRSSSLRCAPIRFRSPPRRSLRAFPPSRLPPPRSTAGSLFLYTSSSAFVLTHEALVPAFIRYVVLSCPIPFLVSTARFLVIFWLIGSEGGLTEQSSNEMGTMFRIPSLPLSFSPFSSSVHRASNRCYVL